MQMNWQQQDQTQLKAFLGIPVLPGKDFISFILHLEGMGKRQVRASMRLFETFANTQSCVEDFKDRKIQPSLGHL